MGSNSTIRPKLVRVGSALAVAACMSMATAAPAAARGWHHGWGLGGAVAAGVIGGALAAATSPVWAPGYYDYDYSYPAYTYGRSYVVEPAYAYEPRESGLGYCEAHFRSYNPATETYLGYDGRYHHCP